MHVHAADGLLVGLCAPPVLRSVPLHPLAVHRVIHSIAATSKQYLDLLGVAWHVVRVRPRASLLAQPARLVSEPACKNVPRPSHHDSAEGTSRPALRIQCWSVLLYSHPNAVKV